MTTMAMGRLKQLEFQEVDAALLPRTLADYAIAVINGNYALEADEVARGFVLTCQALPTTDEVAVDFDA